MKTFSKEDVKKQGSIVVQNVELYIDKNGEEKKRRRWSGLKSYNLLFNKLVATSEKQRCVSEMLSGRVKPYYDIDYDLEKNKFITKEKMDKVIDKFKEELIEYLIDKGFAITDDDIIIMTSHKLEGKTFTKFSYHIVVSPVNYNLLYENQRYDNSNTACDLLYVLYKKDKTWIKYLDRQVYDKDRCLRMCFCNKSPDEKSRLVQWNDYTMRTISEEDYLRTVCQIIFV